MSIVDVLTLPASHTMGHNRFIIYCFINIVIIEYTISIKIDIRFLFTLILVYINSFVSFTRTLKDLTYTLYLTYTF